jgi:hypothetical protein
VQKYFEEEVMGFQSKAHHVFFLRFQSVPSIVYGTSTNLPQPFSLPKIKPIKTQTYQLSVMS